MKPKNIVMAAGAGLLLFYFLKGRKSVPLNHYNSTDPKILQLANQIQNAPQTQGTATNWQGVNWG